MHDSFSYIDVQILIWKKREDKILLWRKITRALKELYEPYSNVNNTKENKSEITHKGFNLDTKDCENRPNP